MSRRRPTSSAGIEVGFSRPTLPESALGGKLPVQIDDPVLDAPGVRHDDDTRLATGISVKQLVQQAEFWWMRKGRKTMLNSRRGQVKTVRGARHYMGAFTLNVDDPNFLPSGILHGLPWDNLDRGEKLQVCKAYHEIRYRKPLRDGMSALLLPSAHLT